MGTATRKRKVFGRVESEISGTSYIFEMSKSGVTFRIKNKRSANRTVIPFNQIIDFRPTTFQHKVDDRLIQFQIIGGKIKVIPISTPQIESEAAQTLHDDAINQMKLI